MFDQDRWCLFLQELGKLSYKEKGWPQKEECDTHVQKFPTWNEFPTTYLPPENKGFEYVVYIN